MKASLAWRRLLFLIILNTFANESMAIIRKRIKNSKSSQPKPESDKNDPVSCQRKTLRKLIKKARDTEFGKKYDFDQILSARYDIALFQKLVPVATYESMNKEWWRRMRRGDKDTCWPGKIKYFAMSSGTTDATSKYIPVSKNMIKSIRKTSLQQIKLLRKFNVPAKTYTRQVLLVGGSTSLEEKNGKFYGDMSGISALHAIPKWFIRDHYQPGYRISSQANWHDRVEAIVHHADQWDIGVVCGIPNWVLMIMEQILAYYKIDNIHEIWPNFNLYIHGGIHFEPYRSAFEKLLGHDIVYAETYMASEGFFGFASEPHAHSIQLALKNGVFYEFIPFDNDHFDEDGNMIPDKKLLTIKNVQVNTEYAVVISNNSGAWRYILGDTIIFTNKQKAEIQITGRIRHTLNLCGEHVSVANMTQALTETMQQFGWADHEFTVIESVENKKYFHTWFIGTDNVADRLKFSIKLDQHLRKLNDDYNVVRKATLGPPVVVFVAERHFNAWLKKNKKIGDQSKMPRVLTGTAKNTWLAFMETKGAVK